MVLKSLMEDKKLNLNQPFLSVRRHPPTLALHKEDKSRTNNSLAVIPQLPPNRPELKSGPVRDPGVVPFQWEHAPGRPKEDIKPQAQNSQKPSIAPKFPHFKYSTDQDSRKDSTSTRESVKERIGTSESSESGNNDEAYADVGDALTRSESFFLNCSVSGVSGLEDLDAEQSGSFSMDTEIREFMMDRFLPAAKAMTSESPQYAPTKQVVLEQAEAKKMVNYDKPSLWYGPSFAKRYSCYHDKKEKEESDDGYDQHGNFPAVCGLLPRLGLMNSLCLMNQLNPTSVRSRGSVSLGNNTQTRSLSAGSYSETESKSDICERHSAGKIRTAEVEENKFSLCNKNGNLQRHNKTSTYHNEPLSYQEESEFIGISKETRHDDNNGSGSERKGYKTFRELLADQGSPRNSDAGPIEKAVYVDTLQMIESPLIRESKGDAGSRDDHGTMVRRLGQAREIDSSPKDNKKFDNLGDTAELRPNALKHSEFHIAPSIDKSNKKWEMMERLKAFGENQENYLVSIGAERIEAAAIEAMESLEAQNLTKAATPKISHKKYSECPVPPPLPKSPSDSWLFRTLPSISAKNAASLRSANPQNQFAKVSARNVRWETIVKSTNVPNQHMHYYEGMLKAIPET